MPACLATSVALAPGSISAATHPSFSKRDQRRRLSTDVMTSIRFMALWLSLVLVTLSYATPLARKAARPGRILKGRQRYYTIGRHGIVTVDGARNEARRLLGLASCSGY